MTHEYRVLVTGSRDWKDRDLVRRALDSIAYAQGFDGMVVVHGHCPTGADHWADEWALDHADRGVIVERHPADWDAYGKAAGPIRNQKMVDLGAKRGLAFPHPESRGTRYCMKLAGKAGIPLSVFTHDQSMM